MRAGGLTILADDGSGASWEPIRAAGAAAAAEASAGHDGEPHADATNVTGETEPEPEPEPVQPRASIPLLVWDRKFGSTEVPGRDAYALRLVTGRTLYDGGRAVVSSPSIAGLAHDPALLVSATDLARIGVDDGAIVKVTSSRSSLNIVVRVESRLPAGIARLAFAPGAPGAADLIDIAAPVTDVRVETLR
jgi:anaerobic selenocysteine-containing dehydrogenase